MVRGNARYADFRDFRDLRDFRDFCKIGIILFYS